MGVVQAVCDQDPDVDAIFRLTHHLPVHFNFDPKVPSRLLVPPKKYSPYNAQATTHMYNVFWGLLLPFTVPGGLQTFGEVTSPNISCLDLSWFTMDHS